MNMGHRSTCIDKEKNLSIAVRLLAEANSLAKSDPGESTRKLGQAERICAHFGESLESLAAASNHIKPSAPPKRGIDEVPLTPQGTTLIGFGSTNNESARGPSPGEGGGNRASGPITDALSPAHHQPGAGTALTTRAATPGDADGLAAEIAALAGFGTTTSDKPAAALVVTGGPSQGGQSEAGAPGAVIISGPPPLSPITQAGAERVANEIAALAGFRSSSDAPPGRGADRGGGSAPSPRSNREGA